MVLIENKEYSEEYVKKAIVFYEDLQNGVIEHLIIERLKNAISF